MDDDTARIRSFNRFYTRLIGALDAQFLDTDITLPEARLLFEIAQRGPVLASDLQARLAMDAGYLSRIISRFESRGWVIRERGRQDARLRPIALTAIGRTLFDELDTRQRAEVSRLLEPLGSLQRRDLVAALSLVQSLLDAEPERTFAIRTFQSGDMGAIASRQSKLYAESHDWTRPLEIIAGDVTTAFLRNFKTGREQCWVAEVNGVMAGSVFLTDEGAGLARLRLLYVEPFARGRGIGEALVETCVGFAREVGYDAVTLWTHTVLETARRIYAKHGFAIVETAMHEAFGRPLQGETWRLDLS